jgi:hypothetical protein
MYVSEEAGSKEEKNKFKNYFDENNRLNKLFNFFEYLLSQTLSPIQKEIINGVSIAICLLLKNQRPPLCYGCVLEYVNHLKSSPLLTSGYNFSSAANEVWNDMFKTDECLWTYRLNLNEINVPEIFEIMNGVLGLDLDCHLTIVKFLNSSIVRKVRLFFLYSIFCFF